MTLNQVQVNFSRKGETLHKNFLVRGVVTRSMGDSLINEADASFGGLRELGWEVSIYTQTLQNVPDSMILVPWGRLVELYGRR